MQLQCGGRDGVVGGGVIAARDDQRSSQHYAGQLRHPVPEPGRNADHSRHVQCRHLHLHVHANRAVSLLCLRSRSRYVVVCLAASRCLFYCHMFRVLLCLPILANKDVKMLHFVAANKLEQGHVGTGTVKPCLSIQQNLPLVKTSYFCRV